MTKLSDALDETALEILESEILNSIHSIQTTQCNTPYDVIDAVKKEVFRVDPLDPKDFVYRVIQQLPDYHRGLIEDPLCFVFSDPPSPKRIEQVSIIRRIFCGWGGAKGQE
jgi:hypothetical protein